MTKSLPWQGIVGGAGAGDDSGRYTAGEWWSAWGIQQRASGLVIPGAGASLRTLAELTNVGIYYDVEDRLIVTDGGGFVADVATGAALVEGTLFYENTARALNLPASKTCYVVVRKNYSAVGYTPPGYTAGDGVVPAYTCRITWIESPAIIEQDTTRVTYWDIPLATVVTGVGGITSVTDTREWVNTSIGIGIAAASNTAIHDVLTLGIRVDDGAGAAGLGAAIRFRLENDAGTAEDAGQIAIRYTDAAAADETRLELRLKASGSDNLSAVINAPDVASADGNARGAGAVDLQQYRTVATSVASGEYSFIAGGCDNVASGSCAHAEGAGTIASNTYSHAEGAETTASGPNSHAEGRDTIASGAYSHTEGYNTIASNTYSHAEGSATIASGSNSHAEGYQTIASGAYSHAEGYGTTADGAYSHAAGHQADTNSFIGVFIWADSEAAAFTADRANQFKVRASGGAHFVQNAAAGAIAVLELQQEDDSEEMVNFIVNGTGAGYPVDTATAVGAAYARLRIAVNGTFKYIQLYDA